MTGIRKYLVAYVAMVVIAHIIADTKFTFFLVISGYIVVLYLVIFPVRKSRKSN